MAPEIPEIDNAALDAAIRAAAESTSLGAEALARGETIAYLDDEGRLVSERPDGMVEFI
jgi:hypothetical protein